MITESQHNGPGLVQMRVVSLTDLEALPATVIIQGEIGLELLVRLVRSSWLHGQPVSINLEKPGRVVFEPAPPVPVENKT